MTWGRRDTGALAPWGHLSGPDLASPVSPVSPHPRVPVSPSSSLSPVFQHPRHPSCPQHLVPSVPMSLCPYVPMSPTSPCPITPRPRGPMPPMSPSPRCPHAPDVPNAPDVPMPLMAPMPPLSPRPRCPHAPDVPHLLQVLLLQCQRQLIVVNDGSGRHVQWGRPTHPWGGTLWGEGVRRGWGHQEGTPGGDRDRGQG